MRMRGLRRTGGPVVAVLATGSMCAAAAPTAHAQHALPSDLSPWGMFVSADIVVQTVMIGLAVASIVTWTVGLAKGVELMLASRRLRAALRQIGTESSLIDAL